MIASLTGGPGLIALLLAGWGIQALTWIWALARVRGDAARRGAWLPELGVRAGVVALVVASLALPHPAAPALGPLAGATCVLVFLAGHAVAAVGRVHLGAAWGIGTLPRPGQDVVRRGLYRLLSHPIYWGTGVAVAAQAALLQNVPAYLLLAGTALINPWKMVRENRWTRAGADGS